MDEKLKGFALLTPERRREIASKGGKKAHAKGTAYKWTIATARIAGRKGGLAQHPPSKAFLQQNGQ